MRWRAAWRIHNLHLKAAWVSGSESGSYSPSEIGLMIGAPAFNRKALPFETETDPDSDAEGNPASPGAQDDARSCLVGAVDYFEAE